ncbi:MAG TPA: WbqC family protein [Acidimicrobiales bacterium]|nr:WbqC family protein [Acidimicrobiales bacterium]
MNESEDQLLLELARRGASRVVAIHQPNYAPWCGFFAKMVHSDLFVLLDDVQIPQGRSLVHRTRVAVQGEPRWLSVPCLRSSGMLIKDVALAGEPWPAKHLGTLEHNYGNSRYFQAVMDVVRPVLEVPHSGLAELNIRLIRALATYLEVTTPFLRSSQLPSSGTGQDRIISLVKAVNGSTYLSGPGGRAYQEPEAFEDAGIELRVREYVPIPYEQLTSAFLPGLSALDALFNEGPDARSLLRYQ